MTTAGARVEWYFSTAGVQQSKEYRWFTWEERLSPVQADDMLAAPIAGTRLLDLTLENRPATVLARLDDGGFVFYANRLELNDAPAGGDHVTRRISVQVLGVAPDGVDPRGLVDAAVAAIQGDLGRQLPLSWTAGTPALDPRPERWPLSGRDVARAQPADLTTGLGLPRTDTSRSRVAADLAALSREELRKFPRDRVLALETEALDRSGLDELQPWRVISSALKVQVTFAWRPKRHDRELVLICGLVVLVVVAVVLALVLA
jgi:hypothetical protein